MWWVGCVGYVVGEIKNKAKLSQLELEFGNKVLIFYFPGMVAEAMCWVGCGGYVVG